MRSLGSIIIGYLDDYIQKGTRDSSCVLRSMQRPSGLD